MNHLSMPGCTLARAGLYVYLSQVELEDVANVMR